jgi:hypothetical protein
LFSWQNPHVKQSSRKHRRVTDPQVTKAQRLRGIIHYYQRAADVSANLLPLPVLFYKSISLAMHSVIYATIVALLVGLYVATRRKTASSLPLPPGPRPLPVIGTVHQAPKSHAWRRYLGWSKAYGPVVHVNMLGQSIIILSSSQVAHDLLAKRGAAFSDRPRLFVGAGPTSPPPSSPPDHRLLSFLILRTRLM